MVTLLTATMNGLNLVLCLGMLGYSIRWYLLLRGGNMQRILALLIGSVVFFFIAAIARAALVWGAIPPDLDYVDISVRTIAFVFLFFAIMASVHFWSNFGSKH